MGMAALESAGHTVWAPPDTGWLLNLGSFVAAFTSYIAPAAQTQSMCSSYNWPWMAFLVFTAAHHSEALIMPVQPSLLSSPSLLQTLQPPQLADIAVPHQMSQAVPAGFSGCQPME